MLQCSTELVCFGNTSEGITEMYTSSKNHLWSLTSHVGLYMRTWPWSNMIWPWPRPCCRLSSNTSLNYDSFLFPLI